MAGLENLSITSDNLKTIESVRGLKSLKSIYLECKNLQSVEGFAEVTSPIELKVFQCAKLTSLQGFDGMSSLENVNIYQCDSLVDISALKNKKQLRTLDLSSCPSLENLNPLASLEKTKNLILRDCGSVTDFSPIAEMASLTHLVATDCQFSDLQLFGPLKKLISLALFSCNLTSLEGSESLPQLEDFGLLGDNRIENFDGLAKLVNLKSLHLGDCPELRTLKPIRNLKKLETLYLSSIENKIEDMELINNLPNLIRLEIREASWLLDVDFFNSRSAITVIWLLDCDSLVDFSGLSKLSSVDTINLHGCDLLESLVDFKPLPTLDVLILRGCSKFKSCAGIEKFVGLKQIDLSQTAVEKLCTKHSNLETIDAYQCDKLEEVDVSGLGLIQRIELSDCKSLKTLRGVSGLRQLRELVINDCKSLETVGVLSDLPQLEKIRNSACHKLTKLKLINCGSLGGMYDMDDATLLEELWVEQSNMFSEIEFNTDGKVHLKKLTIKNCSVNKKDAEFFLKRHPDIEFDYEPSK